MSDKFKMSGTITQVSGVKNGTTKKGDEWKSLTVCVKENTDDYPNELALDYFKTGEAVKFIDGFKGQVGQAVDVEFTANVREHSGRYYNSLNLWSINIVSEPVSSGGGEIDDMPF